MTQVDRKTRQTALAKQLHDARATYEVAAMLDLLRTRKEGVMNQLLTCKGDEFFKLQGEAQAYDKLIMDITRPNPTQKHLEEK